MMVVPVIGERTGFLGPLTGVDGAVDGEHLLTRAVRPHIVTLGPRLFMLLHAYTSIHTREP